MDRRAAVKGALAAAGALGLGSLAPSSAHAQPSAVPAEPVGGATLALTRFLNATAYADLPPLAIEHAKMILASTLSSAAASDAAASDDSDIRTIAHFGTALTAAGLALGERTRVSGRDLIRRRRPWRRAGSGLARLPS